MNGNMRNVRYCLPAFVTVIVVGLCIGCDKAKEQPVEHIVTSSERVLNGRFVDVPLSEVLQAISDQSGMEFKLVMDCEDFPVTIEFVDTLLWQGVLDLCKAYDMSMSRLVSGSLEPAPDDLIDMRILGGCLLQVRLMSGSDLYARGKPQLQLEYYQGLDETLSVFPRELELVTASDRYSLKPRHGDGEFAFKCRADLPREIRPEEVVDIRVVLKMAFNRRLRVLRIAPEKGATVTDGDVTIVVEDVQGDYSYVGEFGVQLKMSWDHGLSDEVEAELRQLHAKHYAQWTVDEKERAWEIQCQTEYRHLLKAFQELADGGGEELDYKYVPTLLGSEDATITVRADDLSELGLRLLVGAVEPQLVVYSFAQE